MKILKLLGSIGLSTHDTFILFSLLETLWWLMYAYSDGADTLIRLGIEAFKHQIHPFMIVQRLISGVKLFLCLGLIWYGTIFLGKGRPIRIYLLSGLIIDTILIVSWICTAIEESWDLKPSNIFGLHYILVYIAFRVGVYLMLRLVTNEIFTTPFTPPPVVGVGTGNENVVGIPDRGSLNAVNNLSFFGKGALHVIQYYKTESEKAFVICALWETLWNISIMISQEIPEMIFDVLIIGPFGSLSIAFPAENFGIRIVRTALGLVAIFLAKRKNERYLKIWIIIYGILALVGMVTFCIVVVVISINETAIETMVICGVFFGSTASKIFILYAAGRFWKFLKSGNGRLVSEAVNNNA